MPKYEFADEPPTPKSKYEFADTKVKAFPSHRQALPPLAGMPRPLAEPGVGLARSGTRALATGLTLGGVSPDPRSAEQVAVEGVASLGTMYGAGVGTSLASRATGPLFARLIGYGMSPEMSAFLGGITARELGAYTGGAAGSLVHSGITAGTGLEGAPKTLAEAATRAQEAGAEQAKFQLGFEIGVPLLKRGIGRIYKGAEATALTSKPVVIGKKLETLQTERTAHLKTQDILAMKEAQAAEIQSISDQVVRDFGPKTTPQQVRDLGATVEQRVLGEIERRRKGLYGELDTFAKESGATGDATDLANVIVKEVKTWPRGKGVAAPFTKIPGRVGEILRSAVEGKVPGKNTEIPLDALLEMRGTLNQERASLLRSLPDHPENRRTVELMEKMLPETDRVIERSLSLKSPEMAAKFGAAKDVYHKDRVIIEKVLEQRIRKAGVTSLVDEIQPNSPRNVEQIRTLLGKAFPPDVARKHEQALVRAKVEELMTGPKGEVDLAGFGKRFRDYGDTMGRLFQTPAQKQQAQFLVGLSDEFAHMKNNPSIKNDQKLAAINKSIEELETKLAGKNLVGNITDFLSRPHVWMYTTAGAAAGLGVAGAHAYGPIGLAGGAAAMVTGAVVGKAMAPRIVKAAENPATAGSLLRALQAYSRAERLDGAAAANLARALVATYKAGETVEEIALIPSHKERDSVVKQDRGVNAP